jgi:hypothetical protein
LEVRLHKVEIGSATTAAMISACAAQCVQKALKETESILLEPMMNMEVTINIWNVVNGGGGGGCILLSCSRLFVCLFVCLMVFNTTFNNISVLLMEETGGPGENH